MTNVLQTETSAMSVASPERDDVAIRPASVELRDVRKLFGDFTAVDGMSLSVEHGEFVTLLGPSGCGKTTTLRMIGGFETPSAGLLLINGEEMGVRPPYRRPVNTVFQNYALFPHLTVGQNIGYGLEMARVPKGERIRRVNEVLELVRLPHIEKRKPSALSGGQQQRVALARALVNRPEVLLLDEPLGALDLKLRKAMQLELKRLNREVGATFIYVTHDQEEALTMSDRIAVMNEGKILQIGPPAEIYERPRNRFVADFIGQTNFIEGRVMQIRDGLAEVEVASSGTVRGQVTSDVPSGEVAIAVRPEKIALASDFPGSQAPAGWNALSGRVDDLIYLGTHTQHVVRLPNGAAVVVHRQNSASVPVGQSIGDEVTIVFDPLAAAVLTS
jgi:spermidine/putrescine transport system ATP-binding protein